MIERRVLVLAAMAMPLVSGCFFFDAIGWGDDEPYYTGPGEIPPAYNDGTLIVEGGIQSGDMGDIRGYEGDAVASNASYYGTSSSVRLDSLGDNWWVMSYLNISGIDIVTAEPGTYRSDDVGGSGLYLSVTGCSGETYGNYTYDAGSTDATVTITDNGDGTRHIVFDATFENYGTGELQVGSGEFDYRAGQVAPNPYEEPGYVQQAIIASDASQEGSMGDIQSYAGPARTSEGWYYGNTSSIRLDSEGSGWWVMSYLSVSNLDLATAPAGTYQTTSATYTGTEPQVNVTGCSGPSYGNYTVDGGSTDATVILSDNEDGSRNIDVTATYNFTGTPQTAHSTFTFRVM
jgi:hypothetical protein